MTREEAITVLKVLYDNPLFGDVHKAAFNIAIHDIKAYHKWNLNELVLTQKDNEQEPILDKVKQAREKIDEMSRYTSVTGVTQYKQLNREDVLEILDELIESEDKE